MQTSIAIIKFLLIFLFTAIGIFAAFQVLVKPCDIYAPLPEKEARCDCQGIKFNLDNWLGNSDNEITRVQCFGIVTAKY